MSGKVDENVNFVVFNFLRGNFRRVEKNISETVHPAFKFLRDLVLSIFRVNINFKATFIVTFEKGVTEKNYHVATNVRRNVAHANFFVSRVSFRIVGKFFHICKIFVEGTNFFKNFFATDVEIMHAEEEVAKIFALNIFALNFGR